MGLHCPICDSSKIEDYWDQVWGGSGEVVKRCWECELFFLHPQKAVDEQIAFDRNYAQYIAKREEHVSPHSQDSFTDMVEESIWDRYEDIKEYFTGVRSVLEIGAEKGGFLDLIHKDVDLVVGVDACPEYKDILINKGYSGYLYVDEIPKNQRFERICFFSLLEHIIDPFHFLSQLRERLEDSGIMVIELPSANDPLLSLYNIDAFKSFYFQAMHPYVFSAKSIQILVEKCGLKIKHIKYKQRYGLSNHLQWLKGKKPGGSKRFEDIFSQTAKHSYIQSLERYKVTDTLYVIARKN